MITYHERGDSKINVRLEGRTVVHMRRLIGERGGWQYVPVGSYGKGGDIFPTLEACKQSLQAA